MVQCSFNTLNVSDGVSENNTLLVSHWLYLINIDFLPLFTFIFNGTLPLKGKRRICPLADQTNKEQWKKSLVVYLPSYSYSLIKNGYMVHDKDQLQNHTRFQGSWVSRKLALVEILFLINFLKDTMASSSFDSKFSS